ncbi:FET3 [Candida metapsilosis]|uniref:FET3 n=1 Tax=Candida metapsilosis TaxID=273372 RepID=A0A8H7ZHB0_9ASCO|nr:FET3 [Candida metapsilosis]
MLSLHFILLLSCLYNIVASKTHTFDWDIGYVKANPDGMHERRMIGINNQWPNPTIRVKQHDRVILNLYNGLPDRNASLHFHGLMQRGFNGQDGPEMVTQCPVAPGSKITYDFNVGEQTGTYWYHSHSGSQYGDGLRGMIIIDYADKKDEPYTYDEDVSLSVNDHYHLESPQIIKQFLSRFNPTGAEPIPQNSLFNETRNGTWHVEPDKTYLLRIVNMGLFVSQYLKIEDHKFIVVEIDGVAVEPYEVDSLYITVGQRYAVLVKTKSQSDKNYRFINALDMEMLDVIPEDLQLVSTNYLVYDANAPNPQHYPYYDFEKFTDSLDGFNDFDLKPLSKEKLLPEPDITIQVNFSMEVLGDGVTYALFNDKSYVPPKVPLLYTVLSSGELSTNPQIYGSNTNTFVLQGNETVELILNNHDPGKHAFHLHGHNFQVISRSPGTDDEDHPVEFNPHNDSMIDYPEYPMIRDTVEVNSNGYFVLRFKADNPGVWFFHCHVDWHLEQGLALVLVEAPEEIQAHHKHISANHVEVCKNVSVPIQGNAAANMDFLDLTGQNLQQAPLPEGFTTKGYIAMALCTFVAVYGIWSIYKYGIEDVSKDNTAEVIERLSKILDEHDGE